MSIAEIIFYFQGIHEQFHIGYCVWNVSLLHPAHKDFIGIIPSTIPAFLHLKNCINHSIEETWIFPSSLKLGNITPIFKKDDPLDKSNYRPVSILPLLSKVYEGIIYNQLSQHSEEFLNSRLCGFRKAHNTQHPLFKFLHSWQRELYSGVSWVQF